jgi:hypothetical protein
MEFKPQKLNGTTPVIAASIVDQKSDTAIGDFTCIAPSGRWAVFSSKGYGRVYVIDLASADERMLDKALKYPQAIAISPADVAAITDERGIHIVDLATGKLKSLPMKRASRAFFVQPDVLAVYANDQIDFVDAKSGSPVAKPLRAKTMTSMGMDVSCRGAIAVRTINDDAVDALIWNGHTDPIRVPRPKAARINSGPLGLSFSPDGSRLVLVTEGISKGKTFVRILDARSGKELKAFDGHAVEDEATWALVSNDQSLTVSQTGGRSFLELRAGQPAKFSLVDFRGAKPSIKKLLTTDVAPIHPQLGRHGVLLHRGLFLKGIPSPTPLIADDPIAWVSASARTIPASSKAREAKPKLYLEARHIKRLKEEAPAVIDTLNRHFAVAPLSAKTNKEWRDLAQKAAAPLDGIDVSTALDWDYSACVVEGMMGKGGDVDIVEGKSMASLLVGNDAADDEKALKKAAAILSKAGKPRRLEVRCDETGATVSMTLAHDQSNGAGVVTVYFDT